MAVNRGLFETWLNLASDRDGYEWLELAGTLGDEISTGDTSSSTPKAENSEDFQVNFEFSSIPCEEEIAL